MILCCIPRIPHIVVTYRDMVSYQHYNIIILCAGRTRTHVDTIAWRGPWGQDRCDNVLGLPRGKADCLFFSKFRHLLLFLLLHLLLFISYIILYRSPPPFAPRKFNGPRVLCLCFFFLYIPFSTAYTYPQSTLYTLLGVKLLLEKCLLFTGFSGWKRERRSERENTEKQTESN